MAVATYIGGWSYPIIDQPGRFRFLMRYSALNLNDLSVYCVAPTVFNMGGMLKTMILEKLQIFINGAAAGVAMFPSIQTDINGAYMMLEPWTTAAAADAHIWSPSVPVNIIPFQTQDNWMAFSNLTGYAVTDDMFIGAWGFFETEETGTNINPASRLPLSVSLEGYKWPLVRR